MWDTVRRSIVLHMPTPGERKALIFLAGVALLGGTVRAVGAGKDSETPIPTEDLTALDRQLAAAESAAAAKRAARPGSRRGRQRAAEPTSQRASSHSSASHPPPSIATTLRPLDVDRATVAELDALPGVGPAMASRIARWRDSVGGIGSIEALDCIFGVGPAMLARLAPLVTFSGGNRPSCAAPPHRTRAQKRARPS